MTDDDRRGGESSTVPEDPWPHSSYPPLEQPASSSGPRIPWWMVLIAAATVVLAAVAFVVVLAWPSPSSDQDPDGPDAPLVFRPREPVATINFAEPTDNTFSQVVGDRAYVAWQRGGDLEVIALAVATGEELWTSRITGDPDRYWGDLFATSQAVVAVGYPPDDDDEGEDGDEEDEGDEDAEPDPAGLPIAALAPATGEPLWNGEIHEHDQVLAGDGALVLVEQVAGAVRGLAPDTGEEQWRVPFSGGTGSAARAVPVLTEEHLAGPTTLAGAPVGPPYQQLVLVGEDYSAQLIDARDGTVISAGTNVAHPEDVLLAYRDRLYVAFAQYGYRVDTRDLADLAGRPHTVYVTPDPLRRPTNLSLCGADRLCLLDRVEWDFDTAQVRAVDLAADARGDPQRWAGDVPNADQLVPVGDWVLVAGDGGSSPLAGFDRDGRTVLSQSEGIAVRLDPDRLLVFATGPHWGSQNLSVAGLRVDGGGDRVELGQLPQVHGIACSWNDSYLVCPGSEGAAIWRFTG